MKSNIIFYSGVAAFAIIFAVLVIRDGLSSAGIPYLFFGAVVFLGAFFLLGSIQKQRAWKNQQALRETPLLFEWDEDTNTVHA